MLAFYLAALDTEAERIKMEEIYNAHRHVMFRYAYKISKVGFPHNPKYRARSQNSGVRIQNVF